MNPDEQERRAIAEEHLDAPPFQPPHVTERIEPWIRRREAGRAIATLTPKVDKQISMGW